MKKLISALILLLAIVALCSCNTTDSEEINSFEEANNIVEIPVVSFEEVTSFELINNIVEIPVVPFEEVTSIEEETSSNVESSDRIVPTWEVICNGCFGTYACTLYEYNSGTEYLLPSSSRYNILAVNDKQCLLIDAEKTIYLFNMIRSELTKINSYPADIYIVSEDCVDWYTADGKYGGGYSWIGKMMTLSTT